MVNSGKTAGGQEPGLRRRPGRQLGVTKRDFFGGCEARPEEATDLVMPDSGAGYKESFIAGLLRSHRRP